MTVILYLHNGDSAVSDGWPISCADEEASRHVRTWLGDSSLGEVQHSDDIVYFGQRKSVGFVALRAKDFGQRVPFLFLINPSTEGKGGGGRGYNLTMLFLFEAQVDETAQTDKTSTKPKLRSWQTLKTGAHWKLVHTENWYTLKTGTVVHTENWYTLKNGTQLKPSAQQKWAHSPKPPTCWDRFGGPILWFRGSRMVGPIPPWGHPPQKLDRPNKCETPLQQRVAWRQGQHSSPLFDSTVYVEWHVSKDYQPNKITVLSSHATPWSRTP